MKLMLTLILLTSLAQAQQKTPAPKEAKPEAKPEVKFVTYQFTDIQKLQLENIQKDWKIALQQFYITSEAVKKQNNWPDSVRCNIENLNCVGPEQKTEEKK